MQGAGAKGEGASQRPSRTLLHILHILLKTDAVNNMDETAVNMLNCREKLLDNEYADYIISFNGNVEGLEEYFQGDCLQVLDNNLAIVTLPRQNINLMSVITQLYYMVPKCYGLMDSTNLEAGGIIRTQNQPVLNLRGRGTIIGVVDTGIDYRNRLFRNEDGTTRIATIWDQTIRTGRVPEGFFYGSEYTRQEINEALRSEEPLKIVPSMDTQGHGTFVTGIIAGGKDEEADFTGIATQAEIAVVKLKQAKPYLKDFYFIDEEEVYQETDILYGISYLINYARKRNMPISIYLGIGTNSGDHSGEGALNSYLTRLNSASGTVISIAAGNEGNARHHAAGIVTENDEYATVEINVGSGESGFILEVWGDSPNIYAVGFVSPYGEVVERIPPRFMTRQRIPFFLERTVIEVSYVLVEEFTGRQLIFIRMTEPTEGIWRIRIYATGNRNKPYNMWLPIRGFVSEDTFFLQPEVETTITNPGNSRGPICTTAYNHLTNALYFEAGRGYTSDGDIKPDLAAPGVDIYGPSIPAGNYVRRTGTSIATAHTAGAAALLMEWGISRGDVPRLNGTQIKRYLLRGASRNTNMDYPNPLWGYGTLDLYATFETLQERSP